ncbi:MAG: DUF3835 domain-containing protein [Candidatus Coprovivens sp.]
MKTIRQGCFETNSSSTHSITLCMENEFEKWKNGELYWNRWDEKLVPKEEVEKEFAKMREEFIAKHPSFDANDEEWQEELEEYINEDGKTYYSYEDFNDYDYMEYETYEDSLKTPNGETVVAFGYYGNDY